MGFSRKESWSGWAFPSPGHLPDPGIEPASPALTVGSLPLSHLGSLKEGFLTFQFSDCSTYFPPQEGDAAQFI